MEVNIKVAVLKVETQCWKLNRGDAEMGRLFVKIGNGCGIFRSVT